MRFAPRNRHGRLVVATAAVSVLALVAAAEPAATPARGTASTSLSAIRLELTGLGAVPVLSVLDIGSFASTDTDALRNPLARPFASLDLLPLTAGDTVIGGVQADSEQGGSVVTDVVSWSDPLGVLAASVSPSSVTTIADATQALASLDGATATLGALSVLDLAANASGIGSAVDATKATAGQGLTVDALSLDLGDLVNTDILSALPLDVLLDLLAIVPISVPTDLQALVDAVLSAQAVVDTLVAGVGSTATAVTDGVTQLSAALANLSSAEAILAAAQAAQAGAEAAVPALEAAAADAQATLTQLQADLSALDLTTLAATILAYPACVGTLAEAIACLQGLVDAASAALAEANAAVATAAQAVITTTQNTANAVVQVEAVQAIVNALADVLRALVGTLTGLVDDLLATIGGLIAALTNLDGSIGDLVAALADAPLLDVGAIQLGIVATATDSVDTSSTVLGCAPVDLSILGAVVGTGSCDAPLTQASSILASATAALHSVLDALPVVGNLVPAVNVELFPTVERSIVTDGAYTRAMAHVDALAIDIPSVTIDPTQLIDDLLGTLDVDLEALIASILGTVDLDALGLGDLTGTIGEVTAQLPSLADLQAQLDALVDGLIPTELLAPVSTVGLKLDIDPISTAEFAAAGAPATPTQPGVEPAPAPVQPALPTTGGGLAVLGLLTLGGAAGLRRKRA